MSRRRAGGRGGRATAGLLVAVLAAGSCATAAQKVPVDFSPAPRHYLSQDYREVYDRWTRHERLDREIELIIEVWATYKSWDYREAFVAHYAAIYGMNDEDLATLRAAQKEAAEGSYEFVITVQANNYKWNDLDKKSSPWRLALVDGLGNELSAEPIKVEKLPDLFQSEFFPAKTPFTRTYTVRFARPGPDSAFVGERTGSIALRLSGPAGRVDLLWSSR